MSRPEIDLKTHLAVAELVQAAAHHHGLTGPIEFTVLRPSPTPFDPEYLKNTEAFDA